MGMDAGPPRAYGRVRMRKRHQAWRIVAVCGVVGLLLAVTVLSGAAQGFVGIASVCRPLRDRKRARQPGGPEPRAPCCERRGRIGRLSLRHGDEAARAHACRPRQHFRAGQRRRARTVVAGRAASGQVDDGRRTRPAGGFRVPAQKAAVGAERERSQSLPLSPAGSSLGGSEPEWRNAREAVPTLERSRARTTLGR